MSYIYIHKAIPINAYCHENLQEVVPPGPYKLTLSFININCSAIGSYYCMLTSSIHVAVCLCTGGSRLSQIFWEHENQSSLLVIRLIYIKLYRKKETKFWKKIWAKRESSLTTVWLKWDPPVMSFSLCIKLLWLQRLHLLQLCVWMHWWHLWLLQWFPSPWG